jgi:hypothetical protein
VAEQSDFEALLTALAEAKANLLAAEAEATEELIHAKAAYREEPSEENRARKAAAVENIQALRAAVRAGRKENQVAGDAYLSPVQSDGGAA